MKHPFFLSLGDRIHKLPDSEWGLGLDQLVGDFVEQEKRRLQYPITFVLIQEF